jgi:hypothetical protein
MQITWSNIQHPRGYAWHLCVTGNAPCVCDVSTLYDTSRGLYLGHTVKFIEF